MELSEADRLAAIIAAARTLDERIADVLTGGACGTDPVVDEQRLARWRETAARGDADLFAQRLASLGLADSTRLAGIFSDERVSEVPDWMRPLVAAAKWLSPDPPMKLSSAALESTLAVYQPAEPGLEPSGSNLEAAELNRGSAAAGPNLASSEQVLARLLNPLAATAQRLLAAAVPSPLLRVSEAAVDDLVRELRHRLARLLQTCVDTEFRAFVNATATTAPAAPAASTAPAPTTTAPTTTAPTATAPASTAPTATAPAAPAASAVESADAWDIWVSGLLASGLFDLWERYPVLARLVGTTVLFWVARTTELLTRLEQDWKQIEEQITGEKLQEAVAFYSGKSDPHVGHAGVTVVEFQTSSGETTQIVYKPKDLAAESLLAAVIDWANQSGLDLGPSLRVLAAAGYGWVEFAEQEPVASRDEVAVYYRRSGALAALLFALGGNDCHAENLVAHGAQPVIVDAETVLQPAILGEDEVPGAAGIAITDSVLDQLLLPRWLRIGGQAVDISALGVGGTGMGWEGSELVWEHPGTAAAHLVRHRVAASPSPAALELAGVGWVRPEYYSERIESGFRQAWHAIANADARLLAGPLESLEQIQVRVLIRMTRTYARVLETSLRPSLLRHGLDRSFHIEHLARSLLDRLDSRDSLAVADSEREQLEVGDVPFFVVRAADLGLSPDPPIGLPGLAFAESAAARASRRIALISDPTGSDLALRQQLRLLRASLAVASVGVRSDLFDQYESLARIDASRPQRTGVPRSQRTVVVDRPVQVRKDYDECGLVPHAGVRHGSSGSAPGKDCDDSARIDELGPRLRTAAGSLADRVVDHMHHGSGRMLSLTAASPQQWAIDPPGVGLYDGVAGIGLVLLAAGRVLDRPELVQAAMDVMGPGLADARKRPRRLWLGKGIDGQEGVGGLLYGWSLATALAPTSDRDSIVAAMDSLAAAGEVADIPASVGHDLLGGGLGLLAGFMAAADCGIQVPVTLREQAVTVVVDSVERTQSLAAAGGPAGLNGYSHGDSGIAVVLLGTTERGWLDSVRGNNLAESLIRAESARFDTGLADWPDLRPESDSSRPGPGWCNGLPGIGLARGLLRQRFATVAPEVVAMDLRRALTGIGQDVTATDSLCCGTAGRAESLRVLAGMDPSFGAAYWSAIAELLVRAETRQLRLGVPSASPLDALGLYQGISGVLLALLGALEPTLPSALTWLR